MSQGANLVTALKFALTMALNIQFLPYGHRT